VDRLSRLTWLLALAAWALLASSTVYAAACPVDNEGQLITGWPLTRQQTPNTTSWTAQPASCGGAVNCSSCATSSGLSAGAAIAFAETALQDRYAGTQTFTHIQYTSGTTYGVCIVANNNRSYRATSNTITEDCEPPTSEFDCQNLMNVKTLGHADDMPDSFEPQNEICVKNGKFGGSDVPMNCAAYKNVKQTFKRLGPSGARDWLANYTFTGLECDAEPEQTETQPLDADDNDNERCKTGPGGMTWCEGPEKDTDCGFFNDQYVCLKALGTDKCQTKADGSRLCANSAPTPPVPDNGTNGVKAPADDVMNVYEGDDISNQYNYYNSTTTGNSSRDPGVGGNTDGSGAVGPGGVSAGDGAGDGSEEGTSDDEASGGITCTAEPTCSGDPIQCNLLMQQWRTRCPEGVTDEEAQTAMAATEAEVAGDLGDGIDDVEIAALDATGAFGTAGACPSPIGISVMGQSIDLDVWEQGCNMALLFAPFVMVMGWFAAAMMFVRDGGI